MEPLLRAKATWPEPSHPEEQSLAGSPRRLLKCRVLGPTPTDWEWALGTRI